MSEIYPWFLTSGQNPPLNFGKVYISEHAQKPLELYQIGYKHATHLLWMVFDRLLFRNIFK